MAYSNSKTQQNNKIILIMVGIIMSSALIWFAIKYFNKLETEKKNQATINELEMEVSELEEDVLNFQTALEDKNIAIEEKDRQINEQFTAIQALEAKIAEAKQKNKYDNSQVRALQNKINSLQSSVDQYKEEIEVLREENRMLTMQVDSLNTTTVSLERTNEELRTTSQQVQEELDRTKEAASVLRLADFQFLEPRKKGSKSIEGSRARGLDKLNVCFNILPNSIADKGRRTLFMVVENPDGTINTNDSQGVSGEFEFNGRRKAYSSKTEVNFQGVKQEVCIEYSPDPAVKRPFQKGTQFISIYSDGKLLEQGNFTLK